MTYEEFNLRVRRPISQNNYHSNIESVYDIIEELKDYCKKLEEEERQIKRAQDSLDQARIAYEELKK